MTHRLYICSVPIGHNGDITTRVQSILASVSTILCEDTRVTKQLLKRLGIFGSQVLVRMDQIQEKITFNGFDRAIKAGSVAYVTDAGSPGLSDPGAGLVQYARKQHVLVTVLPGASSLTAFISGCGVSFSAHYFGGFLPKKSADLDQAIRHVIHQQLVGIWFESPKRILRLAEYLNHHFASLPVVFAKELTKEYESFFFGDSAEIHRQLQSVDTRGEWVVLLDSRRFVIDSFNDRKKLAAQLKSTGLSAKQVKLLAPLFDCPKNELYDIFRKL